MPTLYIHAGTPKTGSTAIQHFLRMNEEELAKHGILHPHVDIAELNPGFADLKNAYFMVYESSLPTEEERQAEEHRIYEKGFGYIREAAKNAGKIVITEESIWFRQFRRDYRRENFWPTVKRDAAECGCDLKVIVYLRRQDLYAQALWNQAVKHAARTPRKFSSYLKSQAFFDRRADYYETLCEMAGQIGKENLIVRVYEKDRFLHSGAGIYGDFLEAIGEQMEEGYCLPEENKNERLDGNFLEIKRLINRIPEYKEMPADYLYQELLRANSIKPGKKVSYFDYEEQVNFLQQYNESNQKVAREFLGKEDGELFTEPIERLPKWEIDRAAMYEDIIRLFIEVAVSQQRQINELKRELHNPVSHFSKMNKKARAKLKKHLNLKGNR